MIDRGELLGDLKSLTSTLVDDLRGRSEQVPAIEDKVRGQYRAARGAGRTDRSYEEWREDLLAQVAVGWVLATVFVRFIEDNQLYPTPLLSGPGEHRELARDHRVAWLGDHPASGDRDWLLEVFSRYRELPGMHDLLGDHNPIWQFGPSDDGARAILNVWWAADGETSQVMHDFTDPQLDTRFLGDLYQDLSEHAKKAFALLQTPEFIEEFILDRTLDPAIETFGLAHTKVIDPACGSGHFLLGAFDRMLELWRQREPGTPIRELAQRTLDAVNGVDLNPFAVAIARFRLLVAALRASDVKRLADAPDFRFRVAVGDSLIHGTRSGELFTGAEGFSALMDHRYPSEDGELANEILQAGTYQAVVGNPPYITVKEPALTGVYRALYETCYREFSLGVPFTERFFDLATSASRGAGFIGTITANSFMKRQFGKKFVEDWFGRWDFTHVIDTSGAYIPGHGTPTVILLGRAQAPAGDTVRAVLGIRGEPGRPKVPSEGRVWGSIKRAVDSVGFEDPFVSSANVERQRFSSHPWSLQGGAAPRVLESLRVHAQVELGTVATLIGYTGQTNADPVFVAAPGSHERHGVEPEMLTRIVKGEAIRDWILMDGETTVFPYDIERQQLLDIAHFDGLAMRFWPYRTVLGGRRTFAKVSYFEEGRPWWEWHQAALERVPGLSIAFAFVATHNHFILDRGGKVFKQSALLIKLPADATDDDHLRLLGLLNSSTACFWMTQVFHGKGQGGVGQESRAEWEEFREFDGTKLKQFPIPKNASSELARELDSLAQRLGAVLPSSVLETQVPSHTVLDESRAEAESLRAQMVALQEELDWQCYRLYGLAEHDLRAPRESVPPLDKGQRAFEIFLARKMAAGEAESTWFERHGSTPTTKVPEDWPEPYRKVVERRIALIESDRAFRLLERPEHKRRWNWEPWETLEQEAIRQWLLERLEAESLWCDPELRTTAKVADRLRTDQAFATAAKSYAGRPDPDLTELVTGLVAEEAVPFHAAYRFKTSGLRRRREWEQVWEMQRREDAIDALTQLDPSHPEYLDEADAEALKKEEELDAIPVPPKYRKTDYALDTAYRLRGKLDVPQERFISYPSTHIGSDTSLVIGWAGWDHLQRAQALAAHYADRRDEGAEIVELTALLAGLQELVPWLKQWHNDIDPEYGQRMGDFFASFIDTEARAIGRTVEDLTEWTPND